MDSSFHPDEKVRILKVISTVMKFLALALSSATILLSASMPAEGLPQPSTVQVGSEPTAIQFLPDGVTAVVANRSSNSVALVNYRSFRVATYVRDLESPFAVQTCTCSRNYYVAGSKFLYLISSRSGKILFKSQKLMGVLSMASDPLKRVIYLTTGAFGYATILTALNFDTGHIIRQVDLGNTLTPFGPENLALVDQGKLLVMANSQDGSLDVFSTKSSELVRTIHVGGYPSEVTGIYSSNFVAVDASGVLKEIDTLNGAVVAQLRVSDISPNAITSSKDGTLLALAGQNGVTVVKVNPRSLNVVWHVSSGETFSVSLDPNSRQIIYGIGSKLIRRQFLTKH